MPGLPETPVEQADLLDSIRTSQALVCDKLAYQYKVKVLPRPFSLQQAITPRYVRFPVELAEGQRFDPLRKLAAEIATILDRESAQVYMEQGVIWIAVPRRTTYDVALRDYIGFVQPQPHCAPMGLDMNGVIAVHDFGSLRDAPHALITGTSRSGKTTFQRMVSVGLAALSSWRDVALVFFDMKEREFEMLAPDDGDVYYRNVLHPALKEYKAMTGYLAWLCIHMEYRQAHKIVLPRIVIVIDELADLLTVGGAAVEHYITRLLTRGGSAGLHVIAATQTADREALGKNIAKGFKYRITLSQVRAADSVTATTQAGAGAHKLEMRGDMLVGPALTRIQGFNLEPGDVPLLLKSQIISKPRRIGPEPSVKVAVPALPSVPAPGRPKSEFSADEVAAIVNYWQTHKAWPSPSAISRGRFGKTMGEPRAKRLLTEAQQAPESLAGGQQQAQTSAP